MLALPSVQTLLYNSWTKDTKCSIKDWEGKFLLQLFFRSMATEMDVWFLNYERTAAAKMLSVQKQEA